VDREELLAPWTRVLQVPPYPLAVDESADYRRAMTRKSPIRFALLYLPHHLRSAETGGVFSLASHHFMLHRIGAAWRHPADTGTSWWRRGTGRSPPGWSS
jgi:hypothetical protein